MKTILKQTAYIAGASLLIYGLFRGFFYVTHIENPIFEKILSIPVSILIAFLLVRILKNNQ